MIVMGMKTQATGVNDEPGQKAFIVAGYLFASLYMYLVSAPIYWIFLF
jgi:hypothetical protein